MIKKSSKKAKKQPTKKPVKKTNRKIGKKIAAKNCGCCSSREEAKPIGVVTHYFDKIGVAIVKFSQEMKVGATIKIKGARTDFEQQIESMQYEHQPVAKAQKNQEVGVKVKEETRAGDKIYRA